MGNIYSPAPPLEKCLAKTIELPDGSRFQGVDIETHCKIVGAVARELVARMPEHMRNLLFPNGIELVVAAHDVGKVHPHFLEKLLRSTSYNPNSFPGLTYADPALDKQVGFHSGVSQAALAGVGPYIPEIAGAHHGKPADPTTIRRPADEVLGGVEWQSLRMELVDHLKDFFGTSWPQVRGETEALLYTGLTTVADWIGSGHTFDRYVVFTAESFAEDIGKAADHAGFVSPSIRKDLSFSDLFHGFSPRPMQQEVLTMVTEPGIYILEDKMGQGKTEAALAAAYTLLSQGKATGIYFALPTRLTSDAIYDRFLRYLDVILDETDLHRAGLLHGKSWLYELDFGEEGRPGYSWFEPRKRGLLAPFAVGTIDQALMAVMNVMHGPVRLFGLAGKVVILDEVHTYDAYTGAILDVLISVLSRLGCTVIILSATLADERKRDFLQMKTKESEKTAQHYPQLTGVYATQPDVMKRSSPVNTTESQVFIHRISDDREAYAEALERAAAGRYVLWIENTVQSAQEAYKVLASRAAENECDAGLLHSRFTGFDRRRIEQIWVGYFGREGRLNSDGRGRILVGTQVLEQSLDIDADFLVTRMAPTDMLLQRIGRLWRHPEVDSIRVEGARAEVAILLPDRDSYESIDKRSFGPSQFVYAPYVLSRTYEVWSELDSIMLPNDIRPLIAATYRERKENPPLSDQLNELREESRKLQGFARIGMAKAGITWSDSAQTRYSEQTTRDVLLLAKRPHYDSTKLCFVDGDCIDLPQSSSLSVQVQKRIAREINERIFSVPISQAPEPATLQELGWLKPYLFVGRNEPTISVAVVSESGEIRSLNGGDANRYYELFYIEKLGYVCRKKEKGGING